MQAIALVFVSALAVVSANPCGDSEWKYFPATHSCYKLLPDILPWTIAEFKCLFQGSHHVSIESAAENQFVHEVSKHSEIWTGAAFFGKNAVYVNADQSPYGRYEQWQNGVKPAMNKARRCIKMDKNGDWFQSCCKKKTYTICEKKATGPATFEDSNTVSDFRRAKFYRRK